MVDTYAVAISPDKHYLVVKRGDNFYAVIDRKEGITKSTEWKDRKILSSMLIKGNYNKFKKPIKYKGLGDKVEKSRRSVERVDGNKSTKKKSKHEQLILDLGLENVANDVVTHRVTRKSQELVIDLEKADNSHLPKDAERFSYNCSENYNIVYIPVNRLKQVYQSDEALNPTTINRKANEMKSGKPMPPVYIGYDYDVHDGHHSWHAAIKNGYTHVPCKVVGSDPEKVKEAIAKYKEVWKSISGTDYDKRLEKLKARRTEEPKLIIDENKRINPSEDEELWKNEVDKNDKEFRSELGIGKSTNLSLVLDLSKAILNRGKLVKRRVAVRGKNGKVFYRMQWIDPSDKNPAIQPQHPDDGHQTSYAHHEEGLKEMERRQSNRFPVVHHPTNDLKYTEHNYRTDKGKFKEAEDKFHRGEKLPPVRINPFGEILEGHHLVDLARKHGLSHVPSVVVGNSNQKRDLENKLKDKVLMHDEETGKDVDVSTGQEPNAGMSTETASNVDEFNQFTKKKYTKQYLMSEAKRQGIKWDETKKDGTPLPTNSKIMWMRAHKAIEDHIKSGKPFEVRHDEKDVDKRAQQDGKDSIHKYFVKLLEKHGGKDGLMEWAKKNGITWKEKPKHPDINWMYATLAIKKELAKGRMLDGIRTRQKDAMGEANLTVSEEVKNMVKALGQRYGKSNVMRRADELGVEYDKNNKKGEPLPQNSAILWMRAHEAIAKYISKGNNFKMGDEQDTGIKAAVGDYGGVKLSQWQAYAVDLAKRKSQNREPATRKWALKAIMIDKGISQDEAEELYNKLMENARKSKVMIHFDPMEVLPSGVTLLEQLSSDGTFKNDYALNRGYDLEHRESNEDDMFGNDYSSNATHQDRPNYGVIDLFNKGLKSNPFGGEVAFILNDNTKKRTTGSALDSNNIPYGQEGQWLRSMEDPHQLIIDRWHSRWKQPNKRDAQRERMFDSVLDGKTNHDDSRYFESHVHGGIDFQRDVDHLLMPASWKTDKAHTDKHKQLTDFARAFGIDVKYEG